MSTLPCGRSSAAWLALIGVSACRARPEIGAEDLARELTARTGFAQPPEDGAAALPPGVELADGLDADEAVAIALWRSPDFRVVLGELGIARADVALAGFWKEPVLSLLFPLGPKQLEGTLNVALEDLWRRPERIEHAQLDLARTAEHLVAAGLDLARDARLAWIEVEHAERAAQLAAEHERLVSEALRVSEERLRLGAAPPLEASAAALELATARVERRQESDRARLARIELEAWLGLELENEQVLASRDHATPRSALPPEATLIAAALRARPEVRAAEIELETAALEAGYARHEAWKLAALLDANGDGSEGFELGPGLALTIPVPGRGEAQASRARARLIQAGDGLVAAGQHVRAEVRAATVRLEGAREPPRETLPGLLARAEQLETTGRAAVALGEVEPLDAVRDEQRLLATRRIELGLERELRRAGAELERALGCRLEGLEPFLPPQVSEQGP